MKQVRNIKTGVVLTASDRLLRLAQERTDLEVIEVDDEGRAKANPKIEGSPEPEANKTPKKKASKKKASKKAEDGEGEGKGGENGGSNEPNPSEAQAKIEGITGKDDLEEFMRENYGHELDKRKKLDDLKAESLKVIADAEADD